ncbi:MAG: complex I NDUFA9 subunit family protein [Candidatus Zixiibacteriota bacterium]|nr:MAG: complex I NDUFA9 subunit family protein [candidate division Zixibacteria bacterium]
MKIAITGATGFVGGHLVKALSEKGHSLRLLSHRRHLAENAIKSVEVVRGDVHDPESLTSIFESIDAVYHLVGIIAETKTLTFDRTVAEGTKNVVSACVDQGIRRIIYLSAAGTSPNAASKYHKTKWIAEEAIRNSGIQYTIFRPSVIFGLDDGFVSMLVRIISGFPLVPIIGDGRYQMQPVYIDDLVRIMSQAPENEKSLNKTIEVGGPERFQYREIVSILKRVLNKKRGNIYLPLWFMKMNAFLLEQVMKPAPITRDQIAMLIAGNVCDNGKLYEVFDVELTGFENGLRKYKR